jgi:excisionase family DNA binding protein
MKIQFEPEDIEEIARRVADCLKPLLVRDTGECLEDEILTVEQVSRLLKTSKGQIYQWVNNSQHGLGDFPYLKAGRLLRFSKKAVLQWLESTRKG